MKRGAVRAKLFPMDLNALRTWGIVVSGALIAACLAISVSVRGPSAEARPTAEVAQTVSAPVSFLVRFRGGGPIARAQVSAQRGDMARAQREIAAQLQRQTAFAGLCFDRFTTGAAEVVLRSCEAVARARRAAFERDWLTRLRAMRAVAYADLNAVSAG